MCRRSAYDGAPESGKKTKWSRLKDEVIILTKICEEFRTPQSSEKFGPEKYQINNFSSQNFQNTRILSGILNQNQYYNIGLARDVLVLP